MLSGYRTGCGSIEANLARVVLIPKVHIPHMRMRLQRDLR